MCYRGYKSGDQLKKKKGKLAIHIHIANTTPPIKDGDQ